MEMNLHNSRLNIPSRLFWKIFLSLWLAISALTFCVDVAVDALFQAELRESPDLSIGFRAEVSTTLVANTLQHAGIDATRQLFTDWMGKRALPVLVVDAERHDLLQREVPLPALNQALALLAGGQAGPAVQRVADMQGKSHVLFVPLMLLPATVPRQHVYRLANSKQVEIMAMAMISLLFAIGLTWYLYRPIHVLHVANRRFAAGDLGTRVSGLIGSRRDEIADLGRDFDDMASRLQSTIQEKTRLLHDVSHELRSPLARMQIALELVRQNPAKTGDMLERIAYEIDRLDKTLGETLTLSRLKSGTQGPSEECVNLVELLADIVTDARFEAGKSGRQINFTASGDILITGRSEMLRSAFENVIRNAILHTPEGAAVDITLTNPSPAASHVVVKICDGGPGVPDEEIVSMFEPFSRGRGANMAQGYGLGLSIVRHAIESLGGEVSAMNTCGGGLCVELVLPVTTLEKDA